MMCAFAAVRERCIGDGCKDTSVVLILVALFFWTLLKTA